MIPEIGCEKVVRKASGHASCEKDFHNLPGSLSPGPRAVDLLR
jgi:hypothetical protein